MPVGVNVLQRGKGVYHVGVKITKERALNRVE